MNCETDVNECNNATLCQEHSTCVNAPGSFRCICNGGYYENSPGKCAKCSSWTYGFNCSSTCACNQTTSESCDEKLDRRLNDFDNKFTKIFQDLKNEMSEMRLEIYESKKELKELVSKVNTMEESIEFQARLIEDKAEENDDKLQKYIQELEDLKTKMTLQEMHDRRYNLLFYGFPEEKNENLNTVMKSFFTDKLEIPKEDVDSMIFANYHRIPNDGKGPKPIIVKFLCMPDRDLVYSKFLHPVLREEKKRILSDLPVQMKQERERIAKIAYDIRQSEKLQTRIVEQGMSLFLEVRDNKTQPWKRRDITK